MIRMTKAAEEKMKELIEADGAPEAGVRIVATPAEGCGVTFAFSMADRQAEGDFTIADNGVRVYFPRTDFPHLFNAEINHDGSSEIEGFSVAVPPCG
jgi:Fe-S cluster assembly iron-binding protein IscA